MGCMVMEGEEAPLIEYGRVREGKPLSRTTKLSLRVWLRKDGMSWPCPQTMVCSDGFNFKRKEYFELCW